MAAEAEGGRGVVPPSSPMPDVLGLAILAHLATEPDHGYSLMGRLGRFASPTSGGLYRRLRMLAEDGLIVSSWSTPERGFARRVHSVTDAGRRHLAAGVRPLDEFGQYIRGVLRLAGRRHEPARAANHQGTASGGICSLGTT